LRPSAGSCPERGAARRLLPASALCPEALRTQPLGLLGIVGAERGAHESTTQWLFEPLPTLIISIVKICGFTFFDFGRMITSINA
jgi:hypothetical protein